MKVFNKGTLLLLLMVCSKQAISKSGDPLIKGYLDAMRQLSHNCAMNYKATCYYPDKSQLVVSGKLAISNGNYFDSSNIRFVLMNSRWLVMAEHQSKMLNIIYLPDWKKQMGKDFNLDISGYLLSNADMEDFTAFKISPSGNDSFNVSVKYNLDDGQTIDLMLHYPKGGTIPGRYEGVINYPSGTDRLQPASVKIRFECRDISQSIDPSLFDDNRLIKTSGGKAQMKRYNDYKIYKKVS